MTIHESWMRRAIVLAQATSKLGNVPVGALIVRDGVILGEAGNLRHTLQDPTAHAEILALRAAAQAVGSWRLDGATLYVTLEPCPMCASAIAQARIQTVFYGARDPAKEDVHPFEPALQWTGESRECCEEILRDFFTRLRSNETS